MSKYVAMVDIKCNGKRVGGDAKRQSCQGGLGCGQSRSLRLHCAPLVLFTTSTMNGQASRDCCTMTVNVGGTLPALRLRRLDVKGIVEESLNDPPVVKLKVHAWDFHGVP